MSEKVFFENQEVKLCGMLEMPTQDAPIVILCHGFASSKESDKTRAIAINLSSKGIGSLRFDFFAHGESEGDFENITLTRGIADIDCAYNYLKERYPHAKIGLCGSSYGGAAAFYAAPKLKLTGLALICPATYYKENVMLELGKEGITKWKEQGYRTYKDWQEKEQKLNYSFYEDLEQFNPEETAKKITSPVIIIHGTADDIVPHEHSERLEQLIPESTLVSYPGADHRISNDIDRARLVTEIVDFFALDMDAQ